MARNSSSAMKKKGALPSGGNIDRAQQDHKMHPWVRMDHNILYWILFYCSLWLLCLNASGRCVVFDIGRRGFVWWSRRRIISKRRGRGGSWAQDPLLLCWA